MNQRKVNLAYKTARRVLKRHAVGFSKATPKQSEIRQKYIFFFGVKEVFLSKEEFTRYLINENARPGSPIYVPQKEISTEKREAYTRQKQQKISKKANEISDNQRKLNKYKIELKRKATPAERHFKVTLRRLGIKNIFQKGFISGRICIVDFYIPKYKICVELDGGYHFTPEQQRRDYYRTEYLTKKRGLKVIRFTNEEAFNLTDEQVLKRLCI